MVYDAVHVFAKALHAVDTAAAIQTERLSCNKEKSWQDGETLFNYIKMVSLERFPPENFLIKSSFLTCRLKWLACLDPSVLTLWVTVTPSF